MKKNLAVKVQLTIRIFISALTVTSSYIAQDLELQGVYLHWLRNAEVRKTTKRGGINLSRSAYSKGARKARAAMRKRYGKKKGDRIFYAKANKYGKRGKSRSSKANSIYSKGAHRVKSAKKRRRSKRRKRE